MAYELVAGVRLDDVFVDLLGPLVFGKGGQSAGEGGFAGYLPGTVPGAKGPQERTGLERVHQRGGGSKLLDTFGDEGVVQESE